jgi:hypothetical protein
MARRSASHDWFTTHYGTVSGFDILLMLLGVLLALLLGPIHPS